MASTALLMTVNSNPKARRESAAGTAVQLSNTTDANDENRFDLITNRNNKTHRGEFSWKKRLAGSTGRVRTFWFPRKSTSLVSRLKGAVSDGAASTPNIR